MTKEKSRHFSNKGTEMATSPMKRCSQLLLTRKTQVKTSMMYFFVFVRMALKQTSRKAKQKTAMVGKDVG